MTDMGWVDDWARDEMDWARDEAEQEWAARWSEAWDRLEPLGIVSHPEDSDIRLPELERLVAMLDNGPTTGA